MPGNGPYLVLVALGGAPGAAQIVHWLSYNILSFVDNGFAEGEVVNWATQGLNENNTTDYWGPISGNQNDIFFQLYATNKKLDSGCPLSWTEAYTQMQGHIIRGPAILKAHYPN